MSASSSPQTVLAYCKRLWSQFKADARKEIVPNVFAIIAIIIVLAVQFRFGLIKPGEGWLTVFTNMMPVLSVGALYVLYHLLKAPYMVDCERQTVLDNVTKERDAFRIELDKKAQQDLSVEVRHVFLEKGLNKLPDGPTLTVWYVTAIISIINRHQFDNTIREYGLELECKDGRKLTANICVPVKDVVIENTGRGFRDLNKHRKDPLKQGIPAEGAVRFTFGGANLDLADARYTLRLLDAYGWWHKPTGNLPSFLSNDLRDRLPTDNLPDYGE